MKIEFEIDEEFVDRFSLEGFGKHKQIDVLLQKEVKGFLYHESFQITYEGVNYEHNIMQHYIDVATERLKESIKDHSI